MFCDLAAAAATAGGPQLERVATPAPDVDGALQVRAGVARSRAARARLPVDRVHLPHTHIIGRVPRVVVGGVSVAGALVRDDAAAARLIPTTEGGAPLVDVDHAAGRSAGAPGAVVAGAVTAARVGNNHNSQDGSGNEKLGEHEREKAIFPLNYGRGVASKPLHFQQTASRFSSYFFSA